MQVGLLMYNQARRWAGLTILTMSSSLSLSLSLSLSTPPKSPSMARANPFTNQDSTDSRPRPPSPPPATSPVSGGNRAKPTASPSSYHTPAPPREDSVKCKSHDTHVRSHDPHVIQNSIVFTVIFNSAISRGTSSTKITSFVSPYIIMMSFASPLY